MRVALVSTKLGYVERGFESFTRDLFDTLRGSIDVTLFKAAGSRAADEVVVPSLWDQGGVLSRLPLAAARRRRWGEYSFATGMLPRLLGDRYDIVHFSEYDVGSMLLRYRRLCGLTYALLYSNGAPAPPHLCATFDFTQEVTPVRLDEALAAGLPERKLRLAPYGIDCNRFSAVTAPEKSRLRAALGIPDDRIAVLCAAAIKRDHKRVHHLIAEMGRLERDRYFLLVAGHRTDETPALETEARAALGDGFRFLTLPHARMHEAYQAADIFALASLTEGLGIVILEAMAASLPVIVHDDATFRWVVGDEHSLVDMAEPGALARRIELLGADAGLRTRTGDSLCRRVRERFDWPRLVGMYRDLYEHVLRHHPFPDQRAAR